MVLFAIKSNLNKYFNLELKSTGEIATTLPEKRFGKLLYKSKNLSSLLFSGSEAFEEASQFAFTEGVENFYNKKYRNENPNVGREKLESIADTLGIDYTNKNDDELKQAIEEEINKNKSK